MESGAISDKQIKASSQWDSNHAPFQGRLCFQRIFEGGSWSAHKNDLHQWLQVDLGSQYTKVTRVATQGRNAYSQWVTKYRLTYSDDGVNFQYYREQGQTADKVLLYRHATCKIHTKLHPELGWRIFHILNSEDINDYFH